MADLSLYFADGHGGLDDFGLDDFDLDDYGSECEEICITDFLEAGQDNLTPLERLEKYAFSENISKREMVARGLLDVLQEFIDNENDAISVMETAARMSDDGDPTVRAELVEQVPNIARFLHERRPNFPAAFSRCLVPIVVRYLTDSINQVRKTSQAALLVLLDEGLIPKADTETKVCPVLLDLTEPSSDDNCKIEAVAIMCKLVTMLSKDTVERLLLPRFCELCGDASLFQVRKACAANFGELCSVVGRDATEKLLMPKFADLCSDGRWDIRKACAECFTIVSNSTSPEVRRTKLSPLFISLIGDQSRWVRQAAFQSLGRFISTFANPSSTGFLFGEEGTLLEVPGCTSESDSSLNSLNCSEISGCHTEATITNTASNQDGCAMPSPEHLSMVDNVDIHCFDDTPAQTPSVKHEGHLNTTPSNNNNIPMVLESNRNGYKIEQVDENFKSFDYRRPPLPDINGELIMLNSQMTARMAEKEDMKDEEEGKEEECPTSKSSSGKAPSDQLDKPTDASPTEPEASSQHQIQIDSQLAESEFPEVQSQTVTSPTEEEATAEPPPTLDSSPVHEQWERETQEGPSDHSSVESELIESMEEEGKEDSVPSLASEEKPKVQNVIPQQLLDQYLSMADPAHAQTIDTEIAKHCAFSLPGVTLTLGRENWHCLKDTFETLATDVQWKVRCTLAFSLHELAVILGDRLTAADLVPIFNGFLKDVDEVRNGVLKHLYDFLKALHADKRKEHLHQLQEFMVTDNSRNWRFRYELAEQLILIIELYSHYDVYDYLRQIALTLCSDNVSEVRRISYKLVVTILRKLHACRVHDLGLNFINELIERFCQCPKWVGRQAFAFICQAIVEEDCMPMDQFVQHFLPSLLSLSSDPVANVRALVAKALRRSIMVKAYFKQPGCAYSDELEETVMTLQADKDCDVRFFATLDPNKALMETSPLTT